MKKNKVLRQSRSNRFVHWVTAISIFILLFSGFGQLPIFKRYNLVKVPGFEWTADFFSTLTLHYVGAVLLIFVAFYHITVHLIKKEFDIMPKRGDVKESYLIIKAMITKGKEPESDKYLAEQRLAYLFIAVNILVLIITGIIKMLKNTPLLSLSNDALFWVTQIHNIATVLLLLGIIGHLAAFIIKENRYLLPGMFTGYVDEDYVKHRHSIWYKRVKDSDKRVADDNDI